MGERRIPQHLETEILRRAAAGEGPRAITRWLAAEHGVTVAHTSISRFLARSRRESPGNPPDNPHHRETTAPRPRLNQAGPGPASPRQKGARPHAICGAKARNGGRCHHRAGSRTDHSGTGRCWLHGGRSTTTGARESIYLDTLAPEEREIWDAIETSPLAAIVEDIRLQKLRLHRMMRQLQVLKTRGELAGGLLLVEESERSVIFGEEGKVPAGKVAEAHPDLRESLATTRRRIKRSLDEVIRLQEDTITRLQIRLVAAIRLAHRIAQDTAGPAEHDGMRQLIEAIEAGRAQADEEKTP